MPTDEKRIIRPLPIRWDTSDITRQVHALYKRSFPQSEQIPLPFLHANALRRSCQFFAWFAEDDPRCVRALSYSFSAPDLVYIGFLAVNESYRGFGYGSQILQAFRRVYSDRVQVLEIEPVEEGHDNYEQRVKRLAFYEKNGFTPTQLVSHQGQNSFTVLSRNGTVTSKQLQKVFHTFGLGIVRMTVDESAPSIH